MKKARNFRRLAVLLLSMLLAAAPALSAAADDAGLDEKIAESASALSSLETEAGTRLADLENFPAGNSVNDWTACILSYSGSGECYSDYLDALQAYVEKAYEEKGLLHDVKATEYHRIAMTVMALGGDPTAFGTTPEGTPINLIADGTYDYVGRDLGLQGLNGWIWALITLNASFEEVPDSARYQVQDIISEILAAQEPDGGFGLERGRSDVDITAMALQALAPYAGLYQDEITNALNWLSIQVNDDCTVGNSEESGSESIAQIIMALCALEIDPEAPTAFVRGDNTLLTALDKYRLADGSYLHVLNEKTGNSLSTCQALEALLSVRAFHRGAGFVFSQGYNIPNESSAQAGTSSGQAGGSASGQGGTSGSPASGQNDASGGSASGQGSASGGSNAQNGTNYLPVIIIIVAAAAAVIIAAAVMKKKRQ